MRYIAFNASSTAATPDHDLQRFFSQDLNELAAEYQRIRSRTLEDPGTAGDQGEENWAEFLRSWLPSAYTVVTKGRLLGVDGRCSPQVDVVVLNPGYPQRLLTKKVYLASGVAAAFECKTTLEGDHLKEAAKTAALVRQLAAQRSGSPYRELFSPLVYGLLAHSHSWNKPGSTPRTNVTKNLADRHAEAVHPRDMLDVVCVADLGCWIAAKVPCYKSPGEGPEYSGETHLVACSTYATWFEDSGEPPPNAVAVAVGTLLLRLGWEDHRNRPLADYFRWVGVAGPMKGQLREWAPLRHVFSAEVAAVLEARGGSATALWDEWSWPMP
ncbi:DUF6602 domain-containing protein [Nocardia tengchongensis]|uniref:DUF6602 domain-containing protein n=1 Tax=Nocardia tengchongensis TaxID=2055889 RepID=UPI0033F13D0A